MLRRDQRSLLAHVHPQTWPLSFSSFRASHLPPHRPDRAAPVLFPRPSIVPVAQPTFLELRKHYLRELCLSGIVKLIALCTHPHYARIIVGDALTKRHWGCRPLASRAIVASWWGTLHFARVYCQFRLEDSVTTGSAFVGLHSSLNPKP